MLCNNLDGKRIWKRIDITKPLCCTPENKTTLYINYVRVCSVVSDSATAWNVAHQAPLSMEFPSPEYWSGLPFLLQGIFPTHGLNPYLLCLKKYWYMETYIWIYNFNTHVPRIQLKDQKTVNSAPPTYVPSFLACPLLQGLYRFLLFPYHRWGNRHRG